jgi:CelD/BcsL family acetyltransferase involved in cellulose biosynthesis
MSSPAKTKSASNLPHDASAPYRLTLNPSFQYEVAALENEATVCNPHALPQALLAARQPRMSPTMLQCCTASGELVGVWPLAAHSNLPGLRFLSAPVVPLFDLAGTPLVAGEHAADAVRAMLLGLKDGLTPYRTIVVRNLQAEGMVWNTISALHSEGLVALTILDDWERALLDRATVPDNERFLAENMSSSTRKRLRAKRRSLEESGSLSFLIYDHADAIEDAFKAYCALEASGWKGRKGTALKQNDGDRTYVRSVLHAMAEAGRAFVAELRLGESVIASGLFLRCGGEVFFWKTTYDETLARESPGVIFDLMLTDWLYAQPWFTRLDTGSDSSVDPASLIWKQRRRMVNAVISLDPSGLTGKVLVVGHRLRKAAKDIWRKTASKPSA